MTEPAVTVTEFVDRHRDEIGEVGTPPQPHAPAPLSPDPESVRAALWELSQRGKLSATDRYRLAADLVVAWLHVRGRFYFDKAVGDFAAVLYFDATRKLLLPVQGDAFGAWLSDALAMNRAERGFAFVLSAVETEGLSERATGIEPATYWAARPEAVYLSNGTGAMVRVTPGTVESVDNGTDGVLFPAGATLAPWSLIDPVDPFESCSLFRDVETAAGHGKDLFRFWATSLPTDQSTKPPLCLTGPIGSGKTRAIRGLFELYGMPERVNAVHKNGEGDFWVAMESGGLSCFDNADTRTDWLADALASAATGGCMEKRRLYRDKDRVTLRARSWVAVTSANPSFAADAGLADRLLVIRLNRRRGKTAEAALSAEVLAARDAGLSWIAQTLAAALADRDPVPDGLNARHPDFAALAVRIGRAIGRETEAVAAMKTAEADKSLFALENDSIGSTLLECLASRPFTGSAADLLAAMVETDPALESKLSVKRLGRRLSALWPHLQAVFEAERQRNGHTERWEYTFQPPPKDTSCRVCR